VRLVRAQEETREKTILDQRVAAAKRRGGDEAETKASRGKGK